mgnify:CR=1 FL=1
MSKETQNKWEGENKIHQKHKIDSEVSIFWDKISEYLPKSLERNALGDETIFRAFNQAYKEFRPFLISRIEKEAFEKGKGEEKQSLIPIQEKIFDDGFKKGKTETVDKMRRTLNQIKKDLRLSVRSLYSVEIIEEAFNKIENYDKDNSTLQ